MIQSKFRCMKSSTQKVAETLLLFFKHHLHGMRFERDHGEEQCLLARTIHGDWIQTKWREPRHGGVYPHPSPQNDLCGRIAVSQPCSSQDACQSPGRIQGSPLLTGWFSMGENPRHVHRHRRFLVLFGWGEGLIFTCLVGWKWRPCWCSPWLLPYKHNLLWAVLSKFEQPEWTIFPILNDWAKGRNKGECWAPTSCCCMKKALWLAFTWCCFDHALKVVQWPT